MVLRNDLKIREEVERNQLLSRPHNVLCHIDSRIRSDRSAQTKRNCEMKEFASREAYRMFTSRKLLFRQNMLQDSD
jgi:hypothetical protein